MSRDIKFRAWVPYFNSMKKVFELNLIKKQVFIFKNAKGIPNGYVNYDDCQIMQYTGLKDKNGKEIYEGDVIERIIYRNKLEEKDSKPFIKNRNIVIFEDGMYKHDWYIEWSSYNDEWKEKKEHVKFDLKTYIYEFEVIGNIYENPELLEGEKQ